MAAHDRLPSIEYLTFWPIIAVSIFLVCDQVLDDHSDGSLLGEGEQPHRIMKVAYRICVSTVHSTAILAITLSMFEAGLVVQYGKIAHAASREQYLEYDSFASVSALVVLLLLRGIGYLVPPDSELTSPVVMCVSHFAPIGVCFIAGGIQVTRLRYALSQNRPPPAGRIAARSS